jgi:hypothetical protein
VGYFYAALYFAGGVVAIGFAHRLHRERKAKRAWPTSPGKILERGVGEPMRSVSRAYLPRVKYAYSVGGKDYVNDQVYVIRRTGSLKSSVQKLVDRLPDPVPVHYDPDDPTKSYLLENPRSTTWILVCFGIVALLVGLAQLASA